MAWWFKTPLWRRVIGGLVIGAILGLVFGEQAAVLKPFGDAFVRLIKMLIAPLIFATLVSGVIAMGDPKRLGSLGGRALGLYVATTTVAVVLGLVFGTIFKPGRGIDLSAANADARAEVSELVDTASQAGGIIDRLLAIIPTNPFAALATTDVLGIIFFAIVFGVGILLAGERAQPVSRFMESFSDLMIEITRVVMELAPVGVLALMAWVLGTQGLGVLINLGLLAIALYTACLLHIFLTYSGIVKGVLGLPVRRFFGGAVDAQAVAISTASSSATLPVTIECASANLGVKKSVAASVLPLGATINMDGTAIYLGLVALFAAQALGITLGAGDYALVALTAVLASIGAAGIPSAGLFLAATVMSMFNVPDEQAVLIIAFIFPFDRLLDMMRTATNVTGDLAVASAVAKWEGQLDEDTFRARPMS
ncbi:MAG: dicarboxylate/amino acid:cation symporter [Maricaulaceae bacterium]